MRIVFLSGPERSELRIEQSLPPALRVMVNVTFSYRVHGWTYGRGRTPQTGGGFVGALLQKLTWAANKSSIGLTEVESKAAPAL